MPIMKHRFGFLALGLFILLSGHPAVASPPDTRVVYVILDSISSELLYEMLDSGELPNLSAALAKNGVRVDEAVGPYPTMSFNAHASLMTGCWADKHGVTGIRWYDHRTGHNRSYAGLGSELIDRDIHPDVKTVFEHLEDLPTVSIGCVVHRGADRYIPPWLPPDGLRIASLMRRFRKPDPPNLTVVDLTGCDWPAHRFGPKSAWVRMDLRKLDRRIGQFFELVRAKNLDRNTYFFLISDHGQTDARGRVNLYAHLECLGFDILDKFFYTMRTEAFTSHDAVLWMGGVGFGFLYLPHRTPDHIDWVRRPDVDMLRDYPVKHGRVDVIRELASIPQIAFIAVRDTSSGKLAVFSADGQLDIDKDLDAYPDAKNQLPRLMAADRAPDILIVAKEGMEVAWSWHKGRHGGFSRTEIIVPLLAIGPGIRPGRIPRARTIDITPTILQMFGRYSPQLGMDGVPLDLFHHR